MTHDIATKLACAFFFGTLIAALSPATGAKADTCTEINGGTCKSHGKCDTGDDKKHCLDTLKKDGYHCECRKGTNDRPHESSHGPDVNFGISLGFGHGGVGFDVNTGGYCDRWGCPGDYWDYPVFYGPVYFDGEWYEGPVYYRMHHDEYQYWIHGDWRYDEWRGPRPDWVGDVYYGPALGRDYYRSDEFRGWHEHHERGDWHHHNDGDQHDGDHWGHDKDHDGKNGKDDKNDKGDKDKGDKDKWNKDDKNKDDKDKWNKDDKGHDKHNH